MIGPHFLGIGGGGPGPWIPSKVLAMAERKKRQKKIGKISLFGTFFMPLAVWSSKNIFGHLTMVAAVIDFKDRGEGGVGGMGVESRGD